MRTNPSQGIFTSGIPQGNQATQNPVAQSTREEQTRLEGTNTAASSSRHMARRALELQRTLSDSVSASESSRNNHSLEFYRHTLDLWMKHSPSVERRVREEVRKRIVSWQDAGRAEAPLNLSAASLREEAGIEEVLTLMPPLPPGVQRADISGHRFLTLPQHNLRNTLRFLNASECNLQYLSIELPAFLEELNIQNNRIESLPIRLPNSLIRLNASGGRGEFLVPAGILVAASRAENPCEINLRGSRVSAISQRRIAEHNARVAQDGIGREIEIEQGAGNRENNINIYGVGRTSKTLGQAVQAWYNTHAPERAVAWCNIRREAISQANKIPLEEMNKANEEELNKGQEKGRFADPTVHFWNCLDSLKGTREAQIDSIFKRRVTVLLDAMEGDKALRDTCFSIARRADESCHDNVTLGFNEMEQAHLTRCAARGDFTQQKVFDLGVSAFKLQMLDELAKKKAHEIGKDSEELEVVLYYRTKLAEQLKLPHQSRDMLFERIATRGGGWWGIWGGVKSKDLRQATLAVESVANDSKKMIEFLMDWKPWQQDLARRYPDQFKTDDLEKEQAEVRDQMEKLEERSDLNDDGKWQKSKALKVEFENLDGKLFGPKREQLTREFMETNVASAVQSKNNCTIL